MQQGFDAIAPEYDALFTRSAIGISQRDRVRTYLSPLAPDGQRLDILELGCGTGEDALWMAGLGHEVTAADASAAMLDVARAKIDAALLSERVHLCLLRAEEVPSVLSERRFDFIFSNFGVLNCIPPESLRRLAHGLRGLLKPSGRAVLVVMPRSCLWENFYFLAMMRPKEAFRRRSPGGLSARVGDADVRTWYYSPSRLAELFGPGFRLAAQRPVGFAVPPSYLGPFFASRKGLFRLLDGLDRALSRFPALAAVSDHALLDFKVTE